MVEPTPKSIDHLHVEITEKEIQSLGVVETGLSHFRTVFAGLRYGIPIELAFIVYPITKTTLLEEFHKRTIGVPIQKKVAVMLELLDSHFPKLQRHSLKWMLVRAYFFGEVGLWGKFG